MSNLKRKIKKILPQRFIYSINTIKLIPKYIKTKIDKQKYEIPNIKFYSDDETVNMIINERKSLSRFGDGEFMWMAGERLNSFQDYSESFANDLIRAFQNENPDLLIGIPYGLFDSSKCNICTKMYWAILRNDFFKRISKFAKENKKYANASITRPYIDYCSRKYSKECFERIKKIWNKKNIVIIEGEKTKLGIGNDLFSNAKSIKRIICPAVNAYEKIENIKDRIRKNVSKDELIIGALGPTASILASELCNEGYQFIDIGHIDIEYMWFLRKAIIRENIPGKYVNESGEKDCSNIYDNDAEYLNSIIDKVI